MARTVTLLQLRTRSLRRADMATSGFVTSAEVTDLVNDEMPEVYRLLVQVGPPDYYSASTLFTTIAGTVTYTLPADFFVETNVYVQDANGFKRPLTPVNDWGLSHAQTPQSVVSITMEYVPSPTVMSGDSDVFDGIAGWDSLLTCRVARRLLQKRKADSSSVDAEISALTQELMSQARRSTGPRYTRDVEDVWGSPYAFAPYLPAITKYRVRGGNVEFYQAITVWP